MRNFGDEYLVKAGRAARPQCPVQRSVAQCRPSYYPIVREIFLSCLRKKACKHANMCSKFVRPRIRLEVYRFLKCTTKSRAFSNAISSNIFTFSVSYNILRVNARECTGKVPYAAVRQDTKLAELQPPPALLCARTSC